MISVSDALARLFALVSPLGCAPVDLRHAAGRVLAQDAVATRNQPPFAASAMDGYAVRDADTTAGATLRVIGEAPAGRQFAGHVGPGEAVRIFTGAPVPAGADRVIIQEDTDLGTEQVRLGANIDQGHHIRPAGGDFAAGQVVITKGTRLTPAHVALLAAMNLPQVAVTKRPEVAILCTGDELVMPGEAPAPDQIIASNGFGLAAQIEATGATVRLLPLARDCEASLTQALTMARGADLILPVGGASVGDHDLVAGTLRDLGATLEFQKIAVRPGKPVMAGHLWNTPLVGLPGNPVSAMVCATLFVCPMLAHMQGLPAHPVTRKSARLAAPLTANGPREHYMRATLGPEGITPLPSQDSARLSVLAAADALLIRPVSDGPRAIGDMVELIQL